MRAFAYREDERSAHAFICACGPALLRVDARHERRRVARVRSVGHRVAFCGESDSLSAARDRAAGDRRQYRRHGHADGQSPEPLSLHGVRHSPARLFQDAASIRGGDASGPRPCLLRPQGRDRSAKTSLGNQPQKKGRTAAYGAFFLLCLAAVVHIIPYQALFALTIIGLLAFDRTALRRIDYGLLATFVCFSCSRETSRPSLR